MTKAYKIVHGVADDGLIQVSDLNIHSSCEVGNRSEIAQVAIAANPDGGSLGQGSARSCREPLIELDGVAAHIGMGRTRHLGIASLCQDNWTLLKRRTVVFSVGQFVP
jgi:hypothetical protein